MCVAGPLLLISASVLVQLVDGHCKPAAAVLCCSDARVPPELVMDQGLGDLYVIRQASAQAGLLCPYLIT